MIDFLVTDRYAIHVATSYVGTAVVLGWLIVASVRAGIRARRALEVAETERR
ncbi:MAG: heme exporter protein CcmD [Pseudomonadota bacterium]